MEISHSFIIISLMFQLSCGDSHQSEYQHSTYHHSDYYHQPVYSNYTNSRSISGQKRLFDDLFTSAMTLSMNLRMAIPLTDLGTSINIHVPVYFELPTSSSAVATGRSFQGGAGGDTSRIKMYREMESTVSKITGADGHSCLLRAMCETSANPIHDDGLLGDAMNFLMTGSYSAADSLASDKSYFEAQAKGQLSGDCSAYTEECPVSFFKYFG